MTTIIGRRRRGCWREDGAGAHGDACGGEELGGDRDGGDERFPARGEGLSFGDGVIGAEVVDREVGGDGGVGDAGQSCESLEQVALEVRSFSSSP